VNPDPGPYGAEFAPLCLTFRLAVKGAPCNRDTKFRSILHQVQLTPGKLRFCASEVLQSYDICVRRIQRLKTVADLLNPFTLLFVIVKQCQGSSISFTDVVGTPFLGGILNIEGRIFRVVSRITHWKTSYRAIIAALTLRERRPRTVYQPMDLPPLLFSEKIAFGARRF